MEGGGCVGTPPAESGRGRYLLRHDQACGTVSAPDAARSNDGLPGEVGLIFGCTTIGHLNRILFGVFDGDLITPIDRLEKPAQRVNPVGTG